MSSDVKIHKHYGYTIYAKVCDRASDESSEYNRAYIINSKYTHLHTLNDVKAFLATYDKNHYDGLVAEEADRRAKEMAYRLRHEAEKNANVALTTDGGFTRLGFNAAELPALGDDVDIILPKLNKNCSLGEYVVELSDAYHCTGRIDKIAEVSTTVYDRIVNNLMDFSDEDLPVIMRVGEGEAGFVGGNSSDDPRVKDMDFHEIVNDKALLEIYHTTCVTHVVVVTAKNRLPFVIDCSGYNYARYAGFLAATMANKPFTDKPASSYN